MTSLIVKVLSEPAARGLDCNDIFHKKAKVDVVAL